MNKSFLLILALFLSACSTPPKEGTWVHGLGPNKTPLFVPKKVKKECKLEMGQRGAGLRSTYGYINVCKKVDGDKND